VQANSEKQKQQEQQTQIRKKGDNKAGVAEINWDTLTAGDVNVL
jgi:hypothetical protein